MAVINKTGITNGGTIQAEHVTRAIDALSGVSTDTIIASGSFTGSLTGTVTGTGSYASQALSSSFATSASFTTSASFATSASSAVSSSQAVSSSFAISASLATTASFALNAGSSFPFTGSAQITGSVGVTGSLRVSNPATNRPGLSVTGSSAISGSEIGFIGQIAADTNLTADKNGIINLAGLGGGSFTGKLVLPNAQPAQPVAGTIYWDDTNGQLYVYKAADPAGWISVMLT